MLMDLVSDNYGNQLCDTCKKQVGMEGFLILCPLSCDAETVFKLVDAFFNIYPDLISVVPFWSAS